MKKANQTNNDVVLQKTVAEIFQEVKEAFSKPVNFNLLNQNKKLQAALIRLKGYPRPKVYSFFEEELDRRAEEQMEKRKLLRKLAEESPKEVDPRNNEYFFISDEEIERRYRLESRHDLIEIMKWFDANVARHE